MEIDNSLSMLFLRIREVSHTKEAPREISSLKYSSGQDSLIHSNVDARLNVDVPMRVKSSKTNLNSVSAGVF